MWQSDIKRAEAEATMMFVDTDPWSALAEAVKALEAISIPIGPGACYTLAGEQCWCNQHVAVRSLVRIASTLG
jgi:hypothetical protein